MGLQNLWVPIVHEPVPHDLEYAARRLILERVQPDVVRKVVLDLNDVLIFTVWLRDEVHEIDLYPIQAPLTQDWLDDSLRRVRSIEPADITGFNYPLHISPSLRTDRKSVV